MTMYIYIYKVTYSHDVSSCGMDIKWIECKRERNGKEPLNNAVWCLWVSPSQPVAHPHGIRAELPLSRWGLSYEISHKESDLH